MKPNIDKISSYATGWVDATNYIGELLKTCYIVVDPAKEFEAQEEGYMKQQVDDILARAKKSKGRPKIEKDIATVIRRTIGPEDQAKAVINYLKRLK